MSKELQNLREQYGSPVFPKPRYAISECLLLLGEGRKRFYSKVQSGRYRLTKDGSRSCMTHEQLLDAAEGDRDVSVRKVTA